MKIDFLTKQLLLMKNVAQRYWIQVDNKDWQQLLDLIIQRNSYIKELSACAAKDKQRFKAAQSLTELISILSDNLDIHQTTSLREACKPLAASEAWRDKAIYKIASPSLPQSRNDRGFTEHLSNNLEEYAPVLKSA